MDIGTPGLSHVQQCKKTTNWNYNSTAPAYCFSQKLGKKQALEDFIQATAYLDEILANTKGAIFLDELFNDNYTAQTL
jgi:hypothetical protein